MKIKVVFVFSFHNLNISCIYIIYGMGKKETSCDEWWCTFRFHVHVNKLLAENIKTYKDVKIWTIHLSVRSFGTFDCLQPFQGSLKCNLKKNSANLRICDHTFNTSYNFSHLQLFAWFKMLQQHIAKQLNCGTEFSVHPATQPPTRNSKEIAGIEQNLLSNINEPC